MNYIKHIFLFIIGLVAAPLYVLCIPFFLLWMCIESIHDFGCDITNNRKHKSLKEEDL